MSIFVLYNTLFLNLDQVFSCVHSVKHVVIKKELVFCGCVLRVSMLMIRQV